MNQRTNSSSRSAGDSGKRSISMTESRFMHGSIGGDRRERISRANFLRRARLDGWIHGEDCLGDWGITSCSEPPPLGKGRSTSAKQKAGGDHLDQRARGE